MPRWNGTDCCKLLSAKTGAANCKLHVCAGKSERSLSGAQCVRALPSLTSQPTLAVAATSRLISCWCAPAALYSAPQRACTNVLVLVGWDLRLRSSPATPNSLRVGALASTLTNETTAVVCRNLNNNRTYGIYWKFDLEYKNIIYSFKVLYCMYTCGWYYDIIININKYKI